MRTASFTDKHFLKNIFAQPPGGIYSHGKFPALLKNAAEIAAIILLCAFLFAAASLLTMKFLELLILIVKQTFFFPPLFEARQIGVSFAGLTDFIVSISF